MQKGRLLAAFFCGLTSLWDCVVYSQEAHTLQFVAWEHPGQRRLKGVRDLLAAFSQRCPEIRVNFSFADWQQARVRMRYWCGSSQQYAPDLTVLPDIWLEEYAEKLLPLESYLQPRDWEGFIPAILQRCQARGHLVGLPWIVRSRALYYRADLLEKAKLSPPRSLAELRAAAIKLSRPPDIYGLGLPAAPEQASLAVFLDILAATGGRPCDEQGHWQFTSPEAEAALTFWQELQQASALPPELLTWTQMELQEALAQGRLAMLIAGPELFIELQKKAPQLPIKVAPLPTNGEQALPIEAEVIVALRTTAKPELTTRFLRFMATAEAQKAMSLMGSLPTYRAAYEAVRKAPDVAPFVAGLERARGLPMKDCAAAQRIIARALWLALSGRCTAGEALKIATEEEIRQPF